jgi:hypothetical protein
MKPHPVLLLAAALCGGPLVLQAQQPGKPDTTSPPPVPAAAGKADPFIKNGKPAPAEPGAAEQITECLVRMEVFALPPADMRRAMKQFPKQADLYAWLGAEWEKPQATVKLERMDVVRVRSGQRSKLEAIDEYPYPTEWDPPQIPQTIGIGMPATSGGGGGEGRPQVAPGPPADPVVAPPAPAPPAPAPQVPPKEPEAPDLPMIQSPDNIPGSVPAGRILPPWPASTATPSAFATKNTGWTLELDLTVSEDGRSAEMTVAPVFVRSAGMELGSLDGQVVNAKFESRQFSGPLRAMIGKPTLAGTFGRAGDTGDSNTGGDDAARLLFFTVTPAASEPRSGGDPAGEVPTPEPAAGDGPYEAFVHLEAFSLPPAAARRALLTQPDSSSLYASLDAVVHNPDSGVTLENTIITRSRSGNRVQSSAVLELPYATEMDPPQIPQTISLPLHSTATPIPGTNSQFPPWPMSVTCPSAFSVKNLGWTTEMEFTLSDDRRVADLTLAPQRSRFVARVIPGAARDVWQPVFETQQCNVQVRTGIGKPALVSTFTPPTGTDIPGANTSDRVWLLFVTVRIPE